MSNAEPAAGGVALEARSGEKRNQVGGIFLLLPTFTFIEDV